MEGGERLETNLLCNIILSNRSGRKKGYVLTSLFIFGQQNGQPTGRGDRCSYRGY